MAKSGSIQGYMKRGRQILRQMKEEDKIMMGLEKSWESFIGITTNQTRETERESYVKILCCSLSLSVG